MDYDTWNSQTPLDFKKKLIKHFIENTIDYAGEHIKTRRQDLATVDPSQLEYKCSRLIKWLGYVEFQKHTLNELETDKLDRFFFK